jgi:predicted nuclease of predicted toxin-antitoxin system
MKFLLDENIEFRVALFLEGEGHDVTSIARDHPHSLPDAVMLEIARAERRVLLTDDRDFGELVFKALQAHACVLYFRLPAATAEEKILALRKIFLDHGDQLREFFVVTARGVRATGGNSDYSRERGTVSAQGLSSGGIRSSQT